MARKISEIEAAMDANINQVIQNPSGSKFAEWQLWKTIFARAVWTFENIMDAFRTEIEAKIQQKQPGSFEWYYDRILEFQGANDSGGVFQGDDLVVSDGIIHYESIDSTRRIISQCSLSAAEGILAVKVAKKDQDNNYTPLNAGEQIAFGLYLDNIKYPGTKTNVISMAADMVKYNIRIYYNPVFTTATVQTNILAKLEEFRQGQGFNDKVYEHHLMKKISEAEGVVSVAKTSLEAKSEADQVYSAINVVYQLAAGYFNYDQASILEFINYKTL